MAYINFFPDLNKLSAEEAKTYVLNGNYNSSNVQKLQNENLKNSKGEFIFLFNRQYEDYEWEANLKRNSKEILIYLLLNLPKNAVFNVIFYGSYSEKMYSSS